MVTLLVVGLILLLLLLHGSPFFPSSVLVACLLVTLTLLLSFLKESSLKLVPKDHIVKPKLQRGCSATRNSMMREREKQHHDTNPLSNKKFKESTREVRLNLKRKLCLESSGLFKRPRTNECDSGLREERVNFSKADRPLLCSLASEKLKRIRDDEMVVTTPLKRIR